MVSRFLFVILLASMGSLSFADDHMDDHENEVSECREHASPILSVADYNGDGMVTGSDVAELARAVNAGQYYAFYDRDADGKLSGHDVKEAAHDIGKESRALDQELVALFNRFKHFQTVTSTTELEQLGFQIGTAPMQGHGVHWLSLGGVLSTQGLKPADFYAAEGLNVPSSGDSVKAMFWGNPSQPLFNDAQAPGGLSSLDYPAPGGAWEQERVQAFGTPPPQFTSSEDEFWHPHAGLCVTVQVKGAGPEFVLDQHTSFAECQVIPSLVKTGVIYPNAWMNFWMVHMWLFDLNPAGFFGGVHPCVDPDAPNEAVFNGDREVPAFFQMNASH